MRLPDALTIANADNTFAGAPIAQTWADLAIWEEFFNRHRLASVIEIGTWKGGMGNFLAMQCLARNIEFQTVDHHDWLESREFIEHLRGRCIRADVFDAAVMSGLIGEGARPLMLFCDNGDKRRELREIASKLGEGDFVAVHDWGSESGPEDIPPAWEPLLAPLCESMSSLTRFFRVHY